jgi:hypothetical protein
MRVFTAANRSYSRLAAAWVGQVSALGIPHTVYDLGGLGYGVSNPVADERFHKQGVYRTTTGVWAARALHKPAIVADHLERNGGGCYLDADAIPVAPLEIREGGWDIGVTVRRPVEVRPGGAPLHEYLGEINAGVILFSSSDATRGFLERWSEQTLLLGSDQRALNHLIGSRLPRNGTVIHRAGLRVLCLPTDRYNFYYFPARPPADVRVLHLKSQRWRAALVRGESTFDLTRLYATPSSGLLRRRPPESGEKPVTRSRAVPERWKSIRAPGGFSRRWQHEP